MDVIIFSTACILVHFIVNLFNEVQTILERIHET